MSKKSNIELQGNLPIQIIQEENGYSATCSILNLSSQGETIEEALEAFNEVLVIFLEDLIETDSLEKVFLECGWKFELKQEGSPIKVTIPPKTLNTTISLKDLFNA